MNRHAGQLAEAHADAAVIAARLPPLLHFGTSSWAFPGWAGLVYRASRSPSQLARDGLAEYVRHPLLRTVGLDRSYYAPVPIDDLRRYADQVPTGFRLCAKAPASVTSFAEPRRSPGGRPAPNPDVLSPDRFAAEMLEPFVRVFGTNAGPFLLEFPPVPRSLRPEPAAFVDGLDAFLSALPSELAYAVELRDRAWLTDAYVTVLRRHGVAHVYSYWSAMPMPFAQMAAAPVDLAPFSVIRLLLRPGTRYDAQRERFRPFDRLVDPDDQMRDEVAAVARAALGAARPVFVLVNNKAEGSAPLTIHALATRLAPSVVE